MRLFRNKKKDQHAAADSAVSDDPPVGYNPNRDETLFWHTAEGYIIAHDVVSQYEYVEESACEVCGGEFKVVAHLNRAGQGLSEFVVVCTACGTRESFVFDISNKVYQRWWAAQLGPLYIEQYAGPPREPVDSD